MNEIFNPSLLISLGPSGRKALDFSSKLLNNIPEPFLNLTDYYEVEDLSCAAQELQEIIDTKLLSAKYLNKLVDLGYKVRSENISSVKINLYLFWDVYSFKQSAYEVVKIISELNYGNIDKDQHSGAFLYIIPIMEKEWILEEKNSIEAVKNLKEIINFISKEESMFTMDSKVYMLHCVSNDGTRIPKEELEYICGILAYLNVLPSKDPPLAHFNKRLLMNERDYKVGTIGITSLTVFKDKLLEDFSKYLAADILKHASEHETNENYKSYKIFKLMDYETRKNTLKQGVSIKSAEDGYRLGNIERYDIKLSKDISRYPSMFKNWEEYLENQCLTELKKVVDRNVVDNINELIEEIDRDIRSISLNSSLKEAISYIETLEAETARQRPKNKSSVNIDTSRLNKELAVRVNNYPNIIGYITKCVILGAFLVYSIVNLVFPLVVEELRGVFLLAFFMVFAGFVYLDFRFVSKRLNTFIKRYKDEVFKNGGSLINLYIEKNVSEGYKTIINYLEGKKQSLISCINNTKALSKSIVPISTEEQEDFGNLITNLLNFKDRYGFYSERAPRIIDSYRGFSAELQDFQEYSSETLLEKLLSYTAKTSINYIDLDLFQYISFKYKENLNEELFKWINRGIVKSKYLLQYINSELLEEHSLFVTPPEVYRAVKDLPAGSFSNMGVSIIEGKDIYINCISIIRLCLGVNFDNITPVKKLRGRDNNA